MLLGLGNNCVVGGTFSFTFFAALIFFFLVYEILRMGTNLVEVKGNREGTRRLSRLLLAQASHALPALCECVCVCVCEHVVSV